MECEFKCKSETLKFQRYVENLQNLSKEFIDLTQRYSSCKDKHQLDFIKGKKFCSAKNLVKRMKRQTTDWPKIFANHISNKGLVSRICKEISKITDASSQLENREIGVKTENLLKTFLLAYYMHGSQTF